MTDKNDQRLLSSAHSAVTPRKQHWPTSPYVSRQQSAKKLVHRKGTNSARSMIIIHTNIRPQSNSAFGNGNKNADTIPSINDLINLNSRRHNSTQSANANPQHRSLSRVKTSDNNQQQVKSSIRSNSHQSRKSKKGNKRLSKSSKVIPFHNNISRDSIQFSSSSKTKLADGRLSPTGSIGELRDTIEHTKQRKKRKQFYCSFCPCSCLCLLGLLCIGLLLGIILAILLLQFLPKSTTTMSSSTLSIGSSASTTSVSATTTTTTQYICSSSCVNQSWISSNNLLAEWQFDNNLLEDVTNSVTGSAQSPTYATGYVDEALLCDANANQSLTSSPITLTGISFTVDAWIYPTGFPNSQDHSIVGSCPLQAIYECLYLTIHKFGGTYKLYFGFYGDDCIGNTRVSLNEWIHVAFVFESNSLTQSIYVNGILDVSRTAAGPFKANTNSVTIGDIPGLDSFVGSNYFQGIIDRLAISGRDKSACEILEEATLAAYFSFNSGLSLIDSGPNSLSAVGQSVSFVSPGHSLQAISFNGSTSSYFQISGLTGLGITNRPFSISFWVRPRSLSGILVHVSANSSGLGWCIPFLGFAANGSIVAQMFNSIMRSVIGPSIPLAPYWTHIVETWSPVNGLRLYVDNVLVAFTTSMATSYTASSVQNYVTLANSLSGAGVCNGGLLGSMAPFNGDIDEFRIYSRELTANDICTLYVG